MTTIRYGALPHDAAPDPTNKIATDGLTTSYSTIKELVDAGHPYASQAEAEAGVSQDVTMNPLRTAQAIAALGVTQFVSPAALAAVKVPAGGAINQVLAKASATDNDTIWADVLNSAGISDDDDLTVNADKLALRKNIVAWSQNPLVATTTALAAVNTAIHTAAYLTQNGREGQFKRVLTAAYTALIAADTANGLIKVSTVNATYAWLRVANWSNRAADPRWFGAAGDGTTDDRNAWSVMLAAAAVADIRFIDGAAKTYRITTTLTLTAPVEIANATFKPDLGLAPQDLFVINSSNVTIGPKIIVDGLGLTFTPATGYPRCAFQTCLDAVPRTNIHFKDVEVKNWQFSGTNTGTPMGNLVVSHAFRVQYVTGGSVQDCRVRDISGCAVFMLECKNLSILRNDIYNAVWYPINCYGAVDTCEIAYNTIDSDDVRGIFFGGGINIQGAFPYTKPKNIHIHDNTLSGYYGYGQVLRGESCENVTVERNRLINWSVSQWAFPMTQVGIYFDTRGVTSTTTAAAVSVTTPVNNIAITPVVGLTLAPAVAYTIRLGPEIVTIVASNANSPTNEVNITSRGLYGTTAVTHLSGVVLSDNNGPVKNIRIRDNYIEAQRNISITTLRQAILVANPRTLVVNQGANIEIYNNRIMPDPTATNYWHDAVGVEGFDGGFRKVSIEKNSGYVDAGTTSGGAIYAKANSSGGTIFDMWVDDNLIINVAAGNAATMRGICLINYTDGARIGKNTFDGFYTSVYTEASATADIQRGSQNTRNPKSGGIEYVLSGTPVANPNAFQLAAHATTNVYGQVEATGADGIGRTSLYYNTTDLTGGIQSLRNSTAYDPLYLQKSGSHVRVGNPTAGTPTAGSLNIAGSYYVGGVKVLGAQGAAVVDATDAATAITQLNALLARCRAHGLIA